MTKVDPLVEFINAQLDEDQRDFEDLLKLYPGPPAAASELRNYEWCQRMLRGVEAKRLLLEGHEPERGVVSWDSNGAPVYGQVCAACGTDDNPEVWPCRHTRLLAFEWSPHEVYLANREKWQL